MLNTWCRKLKPSLAKGLMVTSLTALLLPMTSFSSENIQNWTAADIGEANLPGSFISDDSNTITLNGSGNDIWNDHDDFYYVYKPIKGDATIITQVLSVEYTQAWAKGAVMFRETLDTGSKNVALDYSAHEHVALQWRPVADERSYYWGRNVGTGPVWLKLERKGDLFTGHYSLDGVNWQLTSSKTIEMSEDIYVGLAASPHVTTANNQVVFSDLQVVQAFNDKAKVYLMAGQSNMQGHGSNSGLADTSGFDLSAQRTDVFMKNIISNNRGLSGLAPGFGERSSKYGVELKMGNVLGDVLPENVYLFKGSQGGTTLDNTAHWRPLAHGGVEGNLYDQLMSGFNDFIQTEMVANNIDYEIAGFIWFQGYNDTFGSEELYEEHLRNLISSVRADLSLPNLPVIITQINDNRGSAGDIVMAAQAKVAQEDPLAQLVYSGDQRPYYHYGNDSYIVIGERIAQAALSQLNYAVTVNDEFTVLPGNQLVVSVNDSILNNDVDVTSATLSSDVSQGTLTLNSDGSFVYQPNVGFVGADSFEYTSTHNGRMGNAAKVTLWVRDNYDALALHYDFDNKQGDAIKDAASGVEASVVRNTVSFEHSGAIGNAAYFDGSTLLHYLTRYPVYDFLNLTTDEDFSLAIWVKPDVGVSTEQILMSNKYYYNSRSGFALTLANNGTAIKGFVGSYDHNTHVDKTKSFIAGDVNLTDGQWHHVAASFGFAEGLMRLYIDGQEVGQTSISDLSGEINKYESAIGDGSGGGNGSSSAFKGYMDDVRLYRKKLSADEVNNLYLR